MDDVVAITQLVLRERQGRDRGWWEQMKACFHPQSHVLLSWFNGTGYDFTDRSKAMSEAGFRPVHRPSPPVVHQQGDRAVLELPIAVEARIPFNGVETDLTSYTRLLYQVERHEGQWKIMVLNCVYERDTMAPAIPGTTLSVDVEMLLQFRPAYRCVAYHIATGGRTMMTDLYGDDQPDRVKALYETAFAWMRA